MIANKDFKSFGQRVLPDANGLGLDLRTAILDARKASMELSDKLYVLENLLEAAEEEGIS